MEIPGPCSICQRQDLLRGCDACGRQVCREHQDDSSALCTMCARKPGSIPRPPGAPGPGPSLPGDVPPPAS